MSPLTVLCLGTPSFSPSLCFLVLFFLFLSLVLFPFLFLPSPWLLVSPSFPYGFLQLPTSPGSPSQEFLEIRKTWTGTKENLAVVECPFPSLAPFPKDITISQVPVQLSVNMPLPSPSGCSEKGRHGSQCFSHPTELSGTSQLGTLEA